MDWGFWDDDLSGSMQATRDTGTSQLIHFRIGYNINFDGHSPRTQIEGFTRLPATPGYQPFFKNSFTSGLYISLSPIILQRSVTSMTFIAKFSFNTNFGDKS